MLFVNKEKIIKYIFSHDRIIKFVKKHIIRNAGLENYSLQESDQYRFKVIANDTISLIDFPGH